MKKIILSAVLMGLVSLPALAVDAQEAKKKGLIKEDCQGYVVALKAEGQAAASDINAKRKAEYERLAKQQGVPVDVVAATTGKKLCG